MTVKKLTRTALIAAAYAALTLAIPVLGYGPIQLRISEAMCILPFFMPESVFGLTLGCLIANSVGTALGMTGAWDILFGTLATLLAALCARKIKLPWLLPLPAVIFNAAIIGIMLTLMLTPGAPAVMLYNIITVGAGQLIVCYGLGIPLFYISKSLNIFR